jgi:6-pyruvoyltetrahydropterin/6-carboxytetrahydropterin synthase
MIYLRRTYRFCSAHRYHNVELTDEENRRVFGKCNYEHGHGHNYELEVILGPATPDSRTGMIHDLVALDALVNEVVIEPFDHRHLNHDVPHFNRVVPTTEEIARYVFDLLDRRLPADLLHGIVLREDATLAAECYRAGAGPSAG